VNGTTVVNYVELEFKTETGIAFHPNLEVQTVLAMIQKLLCVILILVPVSNWSCNI